MSERSEISESQDHYSYGMNGLAYITKRLEKIKNSHPHLPHAPQVPQVRQSVFYSCKKVSPLPLWEIDRSEIRRRDKR
jgi:hypothetical protein